VQGQLTRFDFIEEVVPGGGGPVTTPATIFGTVRNLAGEIIDNPGVEQLAVFADGSEIGRVPLELDAEGDENYRFELPNVNVPDLTTYSVKLIRNGAELPLVESGSWLVFEPVRGEEERFDFLEEEVPGGGGPGGGPIAPQATIYGTIRNLSGVMIDNPNFEQLAIFADDLEIGRVPLEVNLTGDENYRFHIPGIADLGDATFSVKLIRDGQEVPLVESASWLAFEPVPGQLTRFDFIEEVVPGGGGPVTTPDLLGTTEDQAVSFAAFKLALNDSDPDGDAITVTSVSPASAHGTVTLNGGLITYTPMTGYSGPDTFTYTITDARGETAVGTVIVTVTSKNARSKNFQMKFTPNGTELTFVTIPGRSYVIEYSADLLVWIPLTGVTVAGPNGRIEYLDNPLPAPPIRFFRMGQLPE
jgi:hypothetical protein